MHNKIGQGYATNVLKAKQPNGKTAERRKRISADLLRRQNKKAKESFSDLLNDGFFPCLPLKNKSFADFTIYCHNMNMSLLYCTFFWFGYLFISIFTPILQRTTQ